MKYQKLTVEIDRCKATAQAFLNYKRGDCTFDDFVMFLFEKPYSEHRLIRQIPQYISKRLFQI